MKARILMMALVFCEGLPSFAQGVTFLHDGTVMNQFTVQETGVGGLTPDLYYKAFHKGYYNSANATNKNLYRLESSAQAFLQVDMADSIRSHLEDRAKVEAANIVDRQVDVAYLTERGKLNHQLKTFRVNIGVLNSYDISSDERDSWSDLMSSYEYAIRVTRQAYMPNSQRQRQYMALSNLMRENNILLVKRICYLKAKSRLQVASGFLLHDKASIQSAVNSSYDRWKGSWNSNAKP